MRMKALMRNLIHCLVTGLGLLFLAGCSSGGADPDIGGVTLSLAPSEVLGVYQAEMVQDLSSEFVRFEMTAAPTFPDISPSVALVTVDRYRITYSREDGSNNTIGPYERDLGLRVSALSGLNVETIVEFDVIVMSTEDKVFSDWANEFNSDLGAATFTGRVELFGRNDAGQEVNTTFTFQLEAAAYAPYDPLFPEITDFFTPGELEQGDLFLAQWNTTGAINTALLTLPWGAQFPLDGSLFPFGTVAASTAGLGVPEGQTRTYSGATLFVANLFGSDSAQAGDVDINGPPLIPPDPEEVVSIDQFFATPNAVTLGEPVTLTWAVSGAPTQIDIQPSVYSGVPVNLTGKNPAFDSVDIVPDVSVRPVLRAENADGSVESAFLTGDITVNSPTVPSPDPPEIAFFVADRFTYQTGQRPVFFWNITGNYERAEILPINGQRIDVTDVNDFVGPTFLSTGTFTFSLVVTGTEGSVLKEDVVVTVNEIFNLPVVISNLFQEPDDIIDNGDDASFSFTVSDPERRESSYRIARVAGDFASFFPKEGTIQTGFSDVGVAVVDFTDNDNQFFTFEVSAYDDPIFGATNGSTRDVILVTFLTTGFLPDTAPQINNIEFVDGSASLPGSQGEITFDVTDPDTPNLNWRIRTIAGDLDGSLIPNSGSFDTFGGPVAVTYQDDPDTPNEPVIFLIRAEEVGPLPNQFALATLRVDKGAPDPGAGVPTEDSPIGIPFLGLYANGVAAVAETDKLANEVLYYNGNSADPRFYRDAGLNLEISNLSFVFDFAHFTGDPANITEVSYQRNTRANGDNGDMTFVGYFDNGGRFGTASSSPINEGVARFAMIFDTNAFNEGTGIFNLPAAGSQDYTVTLNASDTSGNTLSLTKAITIVVP